MHYHPLYSSHSVSFWISVRGNCSLGICVFSASVQGGKFRSLLCCHLGLDPSVPGGCEESEESK